MDLLAFDASLDQGDAVSLETAIRLYRGGLLEGCQEEWIIPERNRRQQRCLDALEALADIESKAGLIASALQRLRNCVELEPFRETAQYALLALLAQAGDYAGATQVYLPRHQTLRALIDWSYDLLNAQEKLLLQRLSVFPGGWTLEAAEEVASGTPLKEWEILDLLTSLVDKSLVLAEERAGAVRYRMFDTLRHYASEKLEVRGESEQIYARRRTWFLALTEESAVALATGQKTESWLHRLELEDYATARAFGQECLNLRRELGDRSGISEAFGHLGIVARKQVLTWKEAARL